MKAVAVREDSKLQKAAFTILSALFASVIIGLSAPLTFRLPMTPVPFTLQVHLVLFFSLFFQPRYAVLMVLAFLTQGFMGLPVFAGGVAGSLLSPSLGYLVGYLPAAYYLAKVGQERKSALSLFTHFCIANAIVYALGVSYLQAFIGPLNAILYGVVPFLLGDLLKNVFFAAVAFRSKTLS